MIDQLQKSRNYGVNDKPPCENCGQPTSLIRRSPYEFIRRYASDRHLLASNAVTRLSALWTLRGICGASGSWSRNSVRARLQLTGSTGPVGFA